MSYHLLPSPPGDRRSRTENPHTPAKIRSGKAAPNICARRKSIEDRVMAAEDAIREPMTMANMEAVVTVSCIGIGSLT
jgi:hypothetical protein